MQSVKLFDAVQIHVALLEILGRQVLNAVKSKGQYIVVLSVLHWIDVER